ncbi:MAG: MBL fold metallo-hydrolase [Acidobacteria bacterium]|nr:MBL fold metallo-hydrolase [Acidobacteriota bacterium]MBS1865861.1 MBL fold metallo-hydrolase [Acidobacteriota bacterium]
MQNKMQEVSRRRFLAQTSYMSAMYAAASMIPLRALGENLAQDARISATPVVDKGFASVRKVGNGLYATISDTTKGLQTMCNGGFLAGKDSALLIEGFVSTAGAAFQLETLRSVSQVPVKGALDTHYHFDHSLGNAVYGANGIGLWAHVNTAKRIYDNYGTWQRLTKEQLVAPLEKQLASAKSEAAKQHLQGDIATVGNVYGMVAAAQLALPNHAIDPAMGPHKVDLGGLAISIEHYPGHSGTDMIVRVPDQNVVYTGDLFFNGYFPIAFDDEATISGWRNTLKMFASLDKDTIFVPGHGQVCGQSELAMFRSTFDDIEEQARKMYKAGVPVEEAQHQYVIPEKFSKLSTFSWGFSIGPTIQKMYQEWGAKK